jgi:hypothetical protein
MCFDPGCAAEGPIRVHANEALAAWNRRAADPVKAELVKALENIARIKTHPDKNVLLATIAAMKEVAVIALQRAQEEA